MGNKKGQVTVFIIIAIILVASVSLFFIFRDTITQNNIPTSIDPVYTLFLSCIQEDTQEGIARLESQAGYIDLPDFEPGSQHMPFSSQLDFLGVAVPYWYYVSGNNIQKEQVPSQTEMEKQLGEFIDGKISNCDFQDFYDEGFLISLGKPETSVKINGDSVEVSVDLLMNVSNGEDTAVIKTHKVNVASKLGTLYDSARKVYDYEQKNLFLEDYAVDNLRLYAPVDGVELTCAPLTWNAQDIFADLQDAIETNTLELKTQNDQFTLANKDNKYFVENLDVPGDVRFINSKDWPHSFEVTPSQGAVLVSNPVGNQPGLGILGFCYVPYHFVYSIKYPVLVQVSEGNEIFQFPFAVVIQGNNPREPLNTSAVEIGLPELCDNKNTDISVNLVDTKLNPVDGQIYYDCFGTRCDIGKTTSGSLTAKFPQCSNGFIVSEADGFKDSSYQFSTVNPGSVDIVLDKLYETNVSLKLDGSNYNGQATISFVRDDGTAETIIYPNQKSIKLSQGQYEVQVYIYRNSSITIGATTSQQCVDVPQSGVGGFFGLTQQKCFDINFPEQVLSQSLSGGGKQNYFILESELENSDAVEINAQSLPVPNSIDQLSQNYILFDDKHLGVVFK